MDTNTLLILILLFLVLVLLVAIVGLVIYVFKRSESKSLPTQQVINDPAKEFKKIFDDNRNKDKKVLGLCNMCEKELYDYFSTLSKSEFKVAKKLAYIICRRPFEDKKPCEVIQFDSTV